MGQNIQCCASDKEKREILSFQTLERIHPISLSTYLHGIINSCEKLHHKFGIQHNSTTEFFPVFFMLPGKSTHTNPRKIQYLSWVISCFIESNIFAFIDSFVQLFIPQTFTECLLCVSYCPGPRHTVVNKKKKQTKIKSHQTYILVDHINKNYLSQITESFKIILLPPHKRNASTFMYPKLHKEELVGNTEISMQIKGHFKILNFVRTFLIKGPINNPLSSISLRDASRKSMLNNLKNYVKVVMYLCYINKLLKYL